MISDFQMDTGKREQCSAGGRTISYMAWRGLDYCAKAQDPIQKLNIFMPYAYAEDGRIGPYTRENAPVFLPNTVGGYMPGSADEPGEDRFGEPNSIFRALEHGYVVASGGVRGRTSGSAGRKVGRAPAFIVDYKAIIRWLKVNRETLPGDTERIVTNGTSAGGALSALAGTSGNSPDYEPYLREIGAADGTDDIFAASCYCPICNLEHADAAYEWLYRTETVYHQMKFVMTPDGVKPQLSEGELSAAEREFSRELAASFPAYVQSLHLRGSAGTLPEGSKLTLEENGEGTFRDYICALLAESLFREKKSGEYAKCAGKLMVGGCMEDQETYITDVEKESAGGFDLKAFVSKITRMKPVPAFDALDLSSPENEEFGTQDEDGKHFTSFSMAHTKAGAQMADPQIIRMMNPMSYITAADTAKHWRIRHGSFDRDTSFAIPAILALSLENAGYDVDFAFAWGLPHSGDYDLDSLFAWIDGLCAAQKASSR